MEKLFYKKNIAKTLLLIFYAIFTFVVLLHHEIWADEAQAWLVARDLNIFELFAHPSEPIPLFELLKQHKTVYAILSTGAFYTDIQPVYESNKTVLRDQEKFRIYKIERK